MSNGLKTAALVSVILMAACLLLVPASADAASDNIGYGEADGITVRYADASDGVNGMLSITIDDFSAIEDSLSVTVDGFRSVSVAKNLIHEGIFDIGGPQLRLVAGMHTLTVSDGADYRADVVLKVAPKVISVTLDCVDAALKVGETLVLDAEVLPADSLYRDVVWSSSDDLVVSVKDGNLTALKAGSADIIAECGGVTAVCKVTVTDVTYTLKFVSDGQDYKTFQLKEGDAIVKPEDPVKEGYTFTGWDPEVPDVMPAKDLTFNAQWEKVIVKHTVTFLNGYGGEISSIEVAEGAEIPVPELPLREGYTFTGWDPKVPDVMPAEDLTFTAQWEKIAVEYTVTFLDGYEGKISSIEVAEGAEIPVPEPPLREGYTFTGWDPEIPDVMPAEDLTFTAQWEEVVVKHTATFLDGYSGEISFIEVAEGAEIPVPEPPLREGYEFAGWEPEVPERMADKDLVFTAKWLVHKIVDNDDGSETEVKEEIITEDGKNVTVETATSKSDDGKITSQTVVKDDGSKKEAQQNVTIDADALTSDVVDKALTQAQAERSNLSDPDTEVKTTVSVNVGGTSVSISSVSASKLKDDNADLSVGTVNGKVVLDAAVLGTMSLKSGDLVLNVSSDASGLTDKAKKTVGDSRFVNVTLTAGSDRISDLGGKASVTMDFVLSEGMKAAIYYVDDDGNKTFVESVYADGKVTFTTGHFSVYMVEEVPISPAPVEPEHETGIDAIAVVIVTLIVVSEVLVLVYLNRR